MPIAELSNTDVALFALAKLGGYSRKVPTEEIAYEAFSLAKEKFSWRLPKFRQMGLPDKEIARIALMDAAKEKNGCLVEGRAGVESAGKEADGWILTPRGLAWLRANEERIARLLTTSRPKISRNEALRFRNHMRQQPFFQEFLKTHSLPPGSDYAFTDMLNISPDAPREVVQRRFRKLRLEAESAADADAIQFLEACDARFTDLLGHAKPQPSSEEDRR